MEFQLIRKASQIDRRWPMALLALMVAIQLLVPLVSSAATTKSDDGQYVLVCTLQGLQTMLLSDSGDGSSSDQLGHQGPSDCPLCSLSNANLNALASLSVDTPKDPTQQRFTLPVDEFSVVEQPYFHTPARAPPRV